MIAFICGFIIGFAACHWKEEIRDWRLCRQIDKVVDDLRRKLGG